MPGRKSCSRGTPAKLHVFPHEAEKRKCGDGARGSNRVQFVLVRTLFAVPTSWTWSVFSFPMSGTSRKCLSVYVLGVQKKSDSCLVQLKVVQISSLHMGASNPCVEGLGMPRVLRGEHENRPQLKGAHTIHMTHN